MHNKLAIHIVIDWSRFKSGFMKKVKQNFTSLGWPQNLKVKIFVYKQSHTFFYYLFYYFTDNLLKIY